MEIIKQNSFTYLHSEAFLNRPSIILVPLRERYSLAHPNDRAPRFRTHMSPTLPYNCSNDGGGGSDGGGGQS